MRYQKRGRNSIFSFKPKLIHHVCQILSHPSCEFPFVFRFEKAGNRPMQSEAMSAKNLGSELLWVFPRWTGTWMCNFPPQIMRRYDKLFSYYMSNWVQVQVSILYCTYPYIQYTWFALFSTRQPFVCKLAHTLTNLHVMNSSDTPSDPLLFGLPRSQLGQETRYFNRKAVGINVVLKKTVPGNPCRSSRSPWKLRAAGCLKILNLRLFHLGHPWKPKSYIDEHK